MKNELKIEIPSGMEIDLEKSVLKGNEPVIKFKEKCLRYEDIEERWTPIQSQLEKISAIHQLMNIAEYYNARSGKKIDWEDTNQCKYYIIYNYEDAKYIVKVCWYNNYGNVSFITQDDATKVINNPNFTSILDAIFKG